MPHIIDIRSDTVTQPTPAMRRAMAEAPVGDDVYGDDPTVNRLEALAAQKAGKEAALFVPSGTMGNQLAIMTHTRRGDAVVCGRNSHIFTHEVGAAAVLSGVLLDPVDSKDDVIYPDLLEGAVREEDIHCPPTTTLCIENALACGRVVPLDVMEQTYAAAKSHGLNVHMDGARLFNAAVALNVPAPELTRYTDSVMFCLSKGLCAPVGSILAGSREFVARARKNRKLLGGGMRQCGILAAAGIIALEEMTCRLAQDHDNAAWLRQRLATIPGLHVKDQGIQINMVFFTLDHPARVVEALPAKLLERGIKINGVSAGELRFVTSNDVTREDLAVVADCLEALLKEG